MKILIQVNTIDGELETDIQYAVVEVNPEMQQYLTQRLALFNASKQFATDLSDMRFWGCAFITFHSNIDLDTLLGEDEQHVFDEQGYWAVVDDFANDEEASEWEFEQVVLDGDGWYVTANEKDTGVEIKTREIPYDLSQLSA
ncbi:hypothetical protein M0R72_00960 [Candidatus Pacearchaeota archaeon]|jgi:hypothetical protein|nr:hypothetical protein [Candidatus Pacearchaeota archaeon]